MRLAGYMPLVRDGINSSEIMILVKGHIAKGHELIKIGHASPSEYKSETPI